MADTSDNGDSLQSVLQDVDLLDQNGQQLESDYQNFNRAISEAKRLKMVCAARLAHQRHYLEQIRTKLECIQHSKVDAIKSRVDKRGVQIDQVESGLLILNQYDACAQPETQPIDDGAKAEKTTHKKTGKPTNHKQQKQANTSGVVRPQFQVRTDGYQQRIDHYLAQRQLEPKHRRKLKLESILKLQLAVNVNRDQRLLDVMLKATFVGCVDENLFLMQHELDLVLVSICPLNQELFYQMILVDFGNFDYIEFQKPLSLSELVAIYLHHHKPQEEEEKACEIIKPLLNQAPMFKDYFSLKINPETATLEAIPWIIKGHLPVMTWLPDLVYQLATIDDWSDEESCLREISQRLAAFYARPPKKLTTEEEHKNWANNVERLFFPLYKTLLMPSRQLATKSSFFTLTNITELYKFFERC